VKLKRESILNPTSKAVSSAEYHLRELTANKRPPLSSILQTQPKKRKCNIQIKTDNKLEVHVAANATAEMVGTWSQIFQRMALGIKKNDCHRLQTLFPLHENDLTYLDKLKLPGIGETSGDKHYRNLCYYMFETFYACCIRPSDNITENPGCEWQLGLYSKNP
jgi:hypothetical protein